MYKVTIDTIDKKSGAPTAHREFYPGEIDTKAFRETMNEIAVCLYDLDLLFDVDRDGDLVLDDLLGELADQVPVSKTFDNRGKIYKVSGSEEA